MFPGYHGKEMFFANYGKLVHELAAEFYEGTRTARELYVRYLRDFRKETISYYPKRDVYRSYFKDGAAFIKGLHMPEDATVIAVEKAAEFDVNGIKFIGYIDRIDRLKNGGLRIVDHKSRRLKPRSGRANPTKNDKELDEYFRQLYLYAIFVEKEYGELPKTLALNCFRTGTFIEEPFSREAYQNAISWAERSVAEITAETEFEPRMDYFLCNYLCEMQDECEYYQANKKR